jgi:hypothetical protein
MVLSCTISVGAGRGRSPFSTAVASQVAVHEWLAVVHQTTLDVVEFDGLTHSLPDSLTMPPWFVR